jgi:hypothetical protein
MQQRNRKYLFNNIIGIVGLFSLIVFGAFAQSSLFQKNANVPAAKISEKEASQVLILGTVHLRSYGDEFNHDVLDGLLEVLAKYKPDLIGIESLASLVVRDLVNSGDANSAIIEEFAKHAAEFGKRVRKSCHVDWFEANTKVEELLKDIEEEKQDADLDDIRKKLILHFIAANDIYSALLQWSYMPESARPHIDGLDTEILDYFSRHIHDPNENVSIGIALATRLNHQRIFPINDHRDKEDFVKVADTLSKALENSEFLKSQPWKVLYEELTRIQNKAYRSGDLLPLYIYLNSREYVQRDIESQWQILFKAKLPSGLAQTRVAYWDVRNMGIAANIRRAMALHPGKKMLVIIGASHKGFLDALLTECMDVKVVQLADLMSSLKD